jgi:hypothetical protein
MSEATPRLALPFIMPGQSQKELFHNEALAALDIAVAPAVEGAAAAAPATPQPGQCWIVAAAAAGDFEGRDHGLACWTRGGWRFVEPLPGMLVWKKDQGLWIHWTGASWSGGEIPAAGLVINGKQVVGARLPTVPSPSGGTTIDAECRAAVDALIATFKSHGLIE